MTVKKALEMLKGLFADSLWSPGIEFIGGKVESLGRSGFLPLLDLSCYSNKVKVRFYGFRRRGLQAFLSPYRKCSVS